MAAIVVSDSDYKFELDIQEATRWSLMTVALSIVSEVISDSDDDKEKVAAKRLVSFPNFPVEVAEPRKVSVLSIQLNSSHIRNAYPVPTYLPCRFLRMSLSLGKAMVTVTVCALKGTNVYLMCTICKSHIYIETV